MKYSSKLDMKLPESTDQYNVEDMNDNTKIVDEKLHNVIESDKLKANDLRYSDETGKLELLAGEKVLKEVTIEGGSKSEIRVTNTSQDLVGQTVTCSMTGAETLTGVIGEDYKVTFKVKYVGTYTITCGENEVSTEITTVGSIVDVALATYTMYAFHINGSESDPKSMVTYPVGCKNENFTPAKMNFSTGSFEYGSWEDAFFMPKPCMLKYDGTVDYYLNPNDYTKKADGTDSDVANTSYGGNAMMEWGQNGKRIYYKVVPDSGSTKSATIYIADRKLDNGFKGYSFINHQGKEVDHFYTPIYNGSNVSNKLRSLSGRTVIQNCTADNEITYAKANNTTSDVLWYTEELCDVILINFLLILMGKSVNTQEVYGVGNMSGYVNNSGSNNGMVATGSMNTKGMFWGKNASSTSDNSGVKVFGMENWWGNQWRRYAGHINANGTQKIKLTYGKQDGSSVEGYNTDGSGYISIGSTPAGTSGGYISEMTFNEYGMFSKQSSGSETTYYADGQWFNNSQVDYAYRGGVCYYGARCGAFYIDLDDASSLSDWYIGCAPSCKPLA